MSIKTPPGKSRVEEVLCSLDEVLPAVEEMYVNLHANPELSFQEFETADKVAVRLRAAGFEVTEKIGKTGVVGLLRNGDGPTVMLRGDMDALPVEEKTGLSYASTKVASESDGSEVPVMHACGHDSHTSTLVGAATALAVGREHWQGTLMIVAQPAEEYVEGAKAMLDDGLYRRCARPDVILGQHILPFRAGQVGLRKGPTFAACVDVNVTIHGRGGHGSAPQNAVDPIVIAAYAITKLQTIVSREVDPAKLAVVTVGTIHAGTRSNIIPDEAYMEINVRSFDNDVQEAVVAAIKRIIRAEAQAAGAPKEPEFSYFGDTIVTDNDAGTVATLEAAQRAHFGDERVIELPRNSGSEDFPVFGNARAGGFDGDDIPYAYWGIGMIEAGEWDKAPGQSIKEKQAHLPFNHSPHFAPDKDLTLKTSVEALIVAALAFLD